MNAWSTASPSLQPISARATASSTNVVAEKPITTMKEYGGHIRRRKSISKTCSRPSIRIFSSTRLLLGARALFVFLLLDAHLWRQPALAQWDYQAIAEQLQQQQQQFAASNGVVDDGGYADNVGVGSGELDAAYTNGGGYTGYQQPQQRISAPWFNGGGAALTNFGSSYGSGSAAGGVGNDGMDDGDTPIVRNGAGVEYGMTSVSGTTYQQPGFGNGYVPNSGDYGDANINNGWGGNGGGYGSGMYGGSNTPPFQPLRQIGFGESTSNGGILEEDGRPGGYGGGTFDNSMVNGYGSSNNRMMNNNNNAQQTFNGYGIGGGGGMMGGGNGVDDGLNFKCFGGDVNGNAMMNANNGACQMMMMGGGGGTDGFNGGGSGGIMNGGGGSGGSSRGSEFYSAPFMGNKEINKGGQQQPMGHSGGSSGHLPSQPAIMNSKMMMMSSAASMPSSLPLSPPADHSTHGVVNSVVDHHESGDHNFGTSSLPSDGNGEIGVISNGYGTMHRNGGEIMGMSSSSNNNNDVGNGGGHGSSNNNIRMPTMMRNTGGSDDTGKRGSFGNPSGMTNNAMMVNGPNTVNRKGGGGGEWMPPMNYGGSNNNGGFYRSPFGMVYNGMDNDGGSAESYGGYGANMGGGGGGYSNPSGGGATPNDLDYYDINDGMDGGGSTNMQGGGFDFSESPNGGFNPQNMRRYAEYLELINKKYGIGIPIGGSSNNNKNMGNGMNSNHNGSGMPMNMNNQNDGMMMTRPSSLLQSESSKLSGIGRIISSTSGSGGTNNTLQPTTGLIIGNGESDGKEDGGGTNQVPSSADTSSTSRSSGGYGSYIGGGEANGNANTIVDGAGYYGTSEGGGEYGSQYMRPLNPPDGGGSSNYVDAEFSPPRPQYQSVTSIQALTQQIRRLPAVFYLDSTNAASMQTEQLLRKTYSLPLVSFYVDKIDGGAEPIERNLEELTAYKGMPYLFICGTFIGSQEHIDSYHNNKQIPQLVEYVCGENNNNKTSSNKRRRKKKQRPSRPPKQ